MPGATKDTSLRPIEASPIARFPMRLLVLVATMTLGLVAIIAVTAWSNHVARVETRASDARVVELAGIVTHLDEVLTMSARMAAATNDDTWQVRYQRFEPQLTAALSELIGVAPDAFSTEAARQTDDANDILVAMEVQAFAALDEGKPDEAREILFSEEYEREKRTYAAGMQEIMSQLRARGTTRAETGERVFRYTILAEVIALSLLALFWWRLVRVIRRRIDERNSAMAVLASWNDALETRVAERTRAIETRDRKLVETNRELIVAREHAQESSRLKSQFLANMSHEIRTPMNALMAMNSLMLRADLSDEQRRRARVIQNSSNDLLNLLNDILDISRIEAGKLEIELIRFDLAELVDDLSAAMLPTVRDKGLELITRIHPAVPTRLVSDPLRVRQILANLLSNAIKFTPEGQVRVDVTAGVTTEGDACLRFDVTDTGIGFPKEHAARVFEAFTQLDASVSRRFGGSGLGLAIVRQLVHLLGGKAGVESEEGKGSNFWVELPILLDSAADAGDVPRVASARDDNDPLSRGLRHDLRVLLVEDNEVNQAVATEILTNAGCEVALAENGEVALRLTADDTFDLVFMDCQMPVMDGYETTKRIRARESGDVHLTIVALTAHAMTEERQRCLDAGMDDYLTKPIDMGRLKAILLRYGGAADPGEEQGTFRAAEEKRELEKNFAALFIRAGRGKLKTLKAAFAAEDREQMARLAHQLKGSIGTLSTPRLAELADRFEAVNETTPLEALAGALGELERELELAIAAIRDRVGLTSE